MRLVLFVLMLCLSPFFARATPYMEPPDLFSGVETMILRAGVDGYPIDAQVLRGIGYYNNDGTISDTLTTFGIGIIGGQNVRAALMTNWWEDGDESARHRLLWRANLDSIPSSAVIVRARLFLRPCHDSERDPDLTIIMAHSIAGLVGGWQQITTGTNIYGFRLLRDWDPESVNWHYRFDHQDSTWHSSGITDSAGTYLCAECPTPGTYNILAQLSRTGDGKTSFTTMGPYWDDVYLDIQADNIYSGYGDQGILNADYINEPVTYTTIGRAKTVMGAGGSLRGWVALDVTRPVSMWHYGVWANYGLLLDTNFSQDYLSWGFWSEYYDGYSPMLVIEYLHAKSGSHLGGSKRKISPTKMFDKGISP